MSQFDVANFEAIVRGRRSVRGFTAQRASQQTLEQIFSVAQSAPSNCNTQPWFSYVVSGKKLETMRTGLVDALLAGQFSMDFPYEGKYQGVYKERQHDAAARLYTAMGISREQKDKRNEAFLRNFSFFRAPHAVFLFLPEAAGIREAGDLGMYAQTLMLAMTAYGLASCPQTALSFHADYVREQLGVDSNQKLLLGISFGYEDPENPANDCRVPRAALAETTTFIE
jgi:hypothetical protein